MNRDRDRKRNRERYTEKETKSITTVFFCDCTAVNPALLLTIQARAQATLSLEKTFSLPYLIVTSGFDSNTFMCNLSFAAI